ncbi:hypothetical protein, partial [Parabacteroides goldsteinii]|uniref:hypothetical protein n=1 Tax=Parabacteroides goldsteinii TaxID=328812 RepID=UPI00259BB446
MTKNVRSWYNRSEKNKCFHKSPYRGSKMPGENRRGGWKMILSRAQLEEIAAAVTDDFDRFFFGVSPEEEREDILPTPIDQLAKAAKSPAKAASTGLTSYA